MARKKHRVRKPWGYPKELDWPWKPGDPLHFACACTCGWRRHGLESMEEAIRLTDEHRAETGHDYPDG